jgi:hypothetical protein
VQSGNIAGGTGHLGGSDVRVAPDADGLSAGVGGGQVCRLIGPDQWRVRSD